MEGRRLGGCGIAGLGAVGAGREVGQLAERAGEMLAGGEAGLEGDVSDGLIAFTQEALCEIDAGAEEELVWRDAEILAEAESEVAGRKAGCFCEAGERPGLGGVIFQKLAGAPDGVVLRESGDDGLSKEETGGLDDEGIDGEGEGDGTVGPRDGGFPGEEAEGGGEFFAPGMEEDGAGTPGRAQLGMAGEDAAEIDGGVNEMVSALGLAMGAVRDAGSDGEEAAGAEGEDAVEASPMGGAVDLEVELPDLVGMVGNIVVGTDPILAAMVELGNVLIGTFHIEAAEGMAMFLRPHCWKQGPKDFIHFQKKSERG